MKSSRLLYALLLCLGALPLAARADGPPVSFQFSIGNTPPPPAYVAPPPAVYAPAPVYAPPPVVVSAPPTMIWLPEFGGYVALGLAQPLFYLGGVYYIFSGGRWYTGPYYSGPWRPAPHVPPGLRKFRERDWQRAQERAYRYDRDPHWNRFRPQGVPPGHAPDRGWEHGPGRGPGGDHGPGRGPGPDHGHGHGPGRD